MTEESERRRMMMLEEDGEAFGLTPSEESELNTLRKKYNKNGR